MTNVRLRFINNEQQTIDVSCVLTITSDILQERIKTDVYQGMINLELGPGTYYFNVFPNEVYEDKQFNKTIKVGEDAVNYVILLNRAFGGTVEEIDYPPNKYSYLKNIDIDASPDTYILLKEAGDSDFYVLAAMATSMEGQFNYETLDIKNSDGYIEDIKSSPHEFSIDLTLGDVYLNDDIIRSRDSMLSKLKHMVQNKMLLEIYSNITDAISHNYLQKTGNENYTIDTNLIITSLSITQSSSQNAYDASLDLKRMEFVEHGYHISHTVGKTDIPWKLPDDGPMINITQSSIEVEREDERNDPFLGLPYPPDIGGIGGP